MVVAATAASSGRRPQRPAAPLAPSPAVAVERERDLATGPASTSGRLGGSSSGGSSGGSLGMGSRRRSSAVDAAVAIRAARFAQSLNEQMWHERLAGTLREGGEGCGKGTTDCTRFALPVLATWPRQAGMCQQGSLLGTCQAFPCRREPVCFLGAPPSPPHLQPL